jgi:hypothetical protein
MKRLLVFSLICFLTGLMTIGCERGVRAGREDQPETYQPRPAPLEQTAPGRTNTASQEVKGELMRVDVKDNTIAVRAENGMEQTFKFNDQTMIHGLDRQSADRAKDEANKMQVRNLMGKEGSEVTVTWKDEAGAKTATMINVNDLVQKNKKRR